MRTSLIKSLLRLLVIGHLLVSAHLANASNATGVSILVPDDLSQTLDLDSDHRVQSNEAIFSSDEKRWLDQNGLSRYSNTYKLTFVDEDAQSEFTREQGESLEWAPNSTAEIHQVIAADPLTREQWGLKNTGKTQPIYLDANRSYLVKGTPQNDVGLFRIQKALNAPIRPIRIAILDTGIDPTHPDLSSQIESGWNAIDSSAQFTDKTGHGTHVAGIAAAAWNRSGVMGVAGASGYTKIIPVRVIDSNPNAPVRPQSVSDSSDPPLPQLPTPKGTGLGDAIARGMIHALKNNADVINLSLAWPEFADTPLLKDLFKLAVSRNVIIVASAGNDGTDARVYPCQYDGVICVGSIDADEKLSNFSNYGPSVDVLAPGNRILSTWPENIAGTVFKERKGFDIKNGTSMASPFVAGAAALILSQGFSPEETKLRILMGSQGSSAPQVRFGRLDLERAFADSFNRALIVRDTKAVQKIRWNREQSLSIPVRLMNQGNAPFSGPLAATVLDENGKFTPIGITWNDPALTENANIAPGAKLETSVVLSLPQRLFPGKILIEVRFPGADQPPLRIPVDFAQVLGPDQATLQESGASTGSTTPGKLRSVDIRSGDATDAHVLSTEILKDRFRFHLIRVRPSPQRLSSWEIPTSATETRSLLAVHKVDVDLDSQPETALLFQVTQTSQKKAGFEFRFYNELGVEKVPFRIQYDNKTSILPESFEWMESDGRKIPVWLGSGLTPAEEIKPVGPWDKSVTDRPQYRIYQLKSTGIRTLPISDTEFPVKLLRGSQDSLFLITAEIGKSPAIHKIYELSNGTLKNPRTIGMDHYRSLLGLGDIDSIISLNTDLQASPSSLIAFSGPGNPGDLKTSIFDPVQSRIVGKVLTFRPPVPMDSVLQTIGMYSLKSADGIRLLGTSMDLYHLTLTDFQTGQAFQVSQNRFSFLPSLLFSRTFFPITAQDEDGHLSPAIFIPTVLSTTDAFEVVVGRQTDSGELISVSRPAQYRFETETGCERLGNPLPAQNGTPHSILFRCAKGWGILSFATQ